MALIYSIGGSGSKRIFEQELGPIVKMAEETEGYLDEDEDSEVKSFFEHVISRTEEILSQNSFATNERHISEFLTPIYLLERTVRLSSSLANIVTDETDVHVKQLNDLRVVFSELPVLEKLLEKFLQHFENSVSRPS